MTSTSVRVTTLAPRIHGVGRSGGQPCCVPAGPLSWLGNFPSVGLFRQNEAGPAGTAAGLPAVAVDRAEQFPRWLCFAISPNQGSTSHSLPFLTDADPTDNGGYGCDRLPRRGRAS